MPISGRSRFLDVPFGLPVDSRLKVLKHRSAWQRSWVASHAASIPCPGCPITCCCGNQSRDVEEQRIVLHRFTILSALTNLPLTTNSMAGTGVSARPHLSKIPSRRRFLRAGTKRNFVIPVTEVAKVVVHSPANHHRCHGFSPDVSYPPCRNPPPQKRFRVGWR